MCRYISTSLPHTGLLCNPGGSMCTIAPGLSHPTEAWTKLFQGDDDRDGRYADIKTSCMEKNMGFCVSLSNCIPFFRLGKCWYKDFLYIVEIVLSNSNKTAIRLENFRQTFGTKQAGKSMWFFVIPPFSKYIFLKYLLLGCYTLGHPDIANWLLSLLGQQKRRKEGISLQKCNSWPTCSFAVTKYPGASCKPWRQIFVRHKAEIEKHNDKTSSRYFFVEVMLRKNNGMPCYSSYMI